MNDQQDVKSPDEKNPGKVTIEFQTSEELLREGIVPFPIKSTEIQVNDDNLDEILKFHENLLTTWWCKRFNPKV